MVGANSQGCGGDVVREGWGVAALGGGGGGRALVWEHLPLAFWGQKAATESSVEVAAGMVGPRAGVGEGTALGGSQQSGSGICRLCDRSQGDWMGGGRQEPGLSSQGGEAPSSLRRGGGGQVQWSAGDGSRHEGPRGWESRGGQRGTRGHPLHTVVVRVVDEVMGCACGQNKDWGPLRSPKSGHLGGGSNLCG